MFISPPVEIIHLNSFFYQLNVLFIDIGLGIIGFTIIYHIWISVTSIARMYLFIYRNCTRNRNTDIFLKTLTFGSLFQTADLEQTSNDSQKISDILSIDSEYTCMYILYYMLYNLLELSLWKYIKYH